MSDQNARLTAEQLRSPGSAAVAGIIFSVLLAAIILLIQTSFPAHFSDADSEWLEQYANIVSFSFFLLPFAGLAFLWFMGVARDLLGHQEDQFLSTVFTGSGLLFIAMLFVWAAIGGTIISIYGVDPKLLFENGFYIFGRRLMFEIISVFAMSMAATYVFSTGSIWFRTSVMPRWLVILTWAFALVIWTSAFLAWWVQLVFPLWVFLVSVYILIRNRRNIPYS